MSARELYEKVPANPYTTKVDVYQLHVNQNCKDLVDKYKRDLGELGSQSRAVLQAIVEQALMNKNNSDMTVAQLFNENILNQIESHRMHVSSLRATGPFVRVEG